MPQFHLFRCVKCGAELVGPPVEVGKLLPKIGNLYDFGKPVRCKGMCAVMSAKSEYRGTCERPPLAPPMVQGLAVPKPKIPMKWVQAAPDSAYVSSALYSFLPAVPQAALITALDDFFAVNTIPLLSASSDRFDADDYADPLDAVIVPGAEAAEKHLTTTLVLSRLDKVLEHAGAAVITWGVSVIDRPQFTPGCALNLPLRINCAGANYRFHMELLNDLVNPRNGHAVLPAAYLPAICKAIALAQAGTNGETVQGPNHGYYFWSSLKNRGINVVLKRDSSHVLTVYYCNAVAHWWNNAGLSAQAKLDRTL